MAKTFGETIREMREAQDMGLRVAADRIGISPAHLSLPRWSQETLRGLLRGPRRGDLGAPGRGSGDRIHRPTPRLDRGQPSPAT